MAEDKYNIPTGYNSDLVAQALSAGDAAVAAKRNAAAGVIGNAEQGMYEMLGKMQLQNERSIADRRMQALRSGTTSSGLAALEMQNIQAGQLGATQVMQDSRNERLMMEMEFAGAEQTNRQFMFETLNQNRKDMSAIDAQKYSASQIPGLEDLLPGASPEVILAELKRFNGVELTKAEESMLADYKAQVAAEKDAEGGIVSLKDSFRNRPTDQSWTDWSAENKTQLLAIIEGESRRGKKIEAIEDELGVPRSTASFIYRQIKD